VTESAFSRRPGSAYEGYLDPGNDTEGTVVAVDQYTGKELGDARTASTQPQALAGFGRRDRAPCCKSQLLISAGNVGLLNNSPRDFSGRRHSPMFKPVPRPKAKGAQWGRPGRLLRFLPVNRVVSYITAARVVSPPLQLPSCSSTRSVAQVSTLRSTWPLCRCGVPSSSLFSAHRSA